MSQRLPAAVQAASSTRGPLADRDFRILLAGQGLSALGDGVTFIALPLLVLQLTGSGLQMGVVGVLQMLPDLVVGLPAGALADRWDRRRMMFFSDLARALLVGLIPLSLVLGLPTMGVVLAVVAPLNVMRVVFMAGFTGAVPNLVTREQLGPANSYVEAVFALGWVMGPAIAGLLAAQVGPAMTLAIDAVSFALSAASLAFIRRPFQGAGTRPDSHILAEIREGISFLVRHRTLRAVVAYWGLYMVSVAPLVPAITYYVTVDRGLPADALGLVIAAFGSGSLLGALASSRIVKGRIGRLMMLGTAVSGAMTIVLATVSLLPAMMALAFLAGLGESIVLVSYITLRAGLTPDSLLGRIGSTTRSVSLGLQPLGMLAGGILLDIAGGGRTLVVFGVAIVLMSGISALLPLLRDASIIGQAPAMQPGERKRIEHSEELPTGP